MDRITIGNIAKPQGIRGEIKVNPLTDDLLRFKRLKKAYIGEDLYEVQSCRILPTGVFLKLKDIDDRNAAEPLRNKEIQVDRADAVKLPEGRYFIVDIEKCEAVIDGEVIGKVVEVMQHCGGADVYVIKEKSGKIAMIPAIDRTIIDVDIANKRITLDKQAYEDLVLYED